MIDVYTIKTAIRAVLPVIMLTGYHRLLAAVASWWYGNASRSMMVIGVTGTNGKSTTVSLIGQILMHSGYRIGWTSTATIRIGDTQWLNDTKMTMLGPFALQRLLRRMKQAKCTVAIVEVSSEGLALFRHQGIVFDTAVFTNLTPEHLERHGGMSNYIAAKRMLFETLAAREPKTIQSVDVPTVIVSNADDDVGREFLRLPANRWIGYSVVAGSDAGHAPVPVGVERLVGVIQQQRLEGTSISVDGCPMTLALPSVVNVYNAMAAIAATRSFNIPLATVAEALSRAQGVPGRMEWIVEGQPFLAMVEYSPEPASLNALYQYVTRHHSGRIIHVLGSAGGGRDKARRPIMGQIAASNADIVIVTNEDPYDEDPHSIIDQVAQGARSAIATRMKQLETIVDRGQAITRAVALAAPGDLLLLTGKACEQTICVAGGKKIPWDDRLQLREAIKQKYGNS
ncbi:UDP-N-acetylmuramoyl-L-alanyl-D-glutamate--2,6-diaminopimelate ligase [Candidatus Uhrbacteria bacterium]|nr:UDP-N-acetylmuramoyl-L-alanyl-D-glutamate--2,6-diaminopimelate ligase [Candidatus Uhrbacteria bacterium]